MLIILGTTLYVMSGMLSSVEAAAPLLSAANVARVGYVTLVWFWLGTVLLTRDAYLRTAVSLWVASIAIDGVGAILQAKGVPIPLLGPVMSGRISGFTDHVNNLGGPAAVAIAPALALAIGADRLRARFAWIAALLLIVAALVLSGSVAGMAAGVGAVVVWLFITSCGTRPVLLALVAVVLAVGLSQMQGAMGLPTPVQRVLSVSGQSEGGSYSTVAIRLRGFDAVWAAVGEGGWVGHGSDPQVANIASAEAAHNMLLKAWYEVGWAGAVGMVCMVLGGLGAALLAARLAMTRRLRQLCTSLFAAVAAFLVFSLSSPILSQRYGWISVALALECIGSGTGGRGRPADKRRQRAALGSGAASQGRAARTRRIGRRERLRAAHGLDSSAVLELAELCSVRHA